MTNDLTVISTNNLPDYLRSLQYEDSGVGAGITPRAPRLGITTSKQFTITKEGRTTILPEPRVRGIIVAGAENITKAWYAKSYVPGTKEAPDCFSQDGKTPAQGVKAPQCSNCAACPKNAFGSHPVTGRGKACSDRKMIVFVWEGAPSELMTFNVPTMSLAELRKIDTELRDANIPMQAVMVELTFDPNIIYPVVKIGAVGFVAQDTAKVLMAKSRTAEISDLLRETDFEATTEAPAESLVKPVQMAADSTANPAPVMQQENAGAGRRRRRTKAEMEAARATELGTANQQPGFSLTGNAVLTSVVENATTALGAEDELQALRAKLAALELAKAQPAVQQQAPTHAQAEQPVAAGGVDIGALLNKWKSS